MTEISFTLNGRQVRASAPAHTTLLALLHDGLGATEVRYGCGEGVCGTCTVLLDGESVNACLTLAVQAEGREVTTVRGLEGGGGEPGPLQEAFVRHEGAQCGFCTPGMLLCAFELLRDNPRPTRDEVRRALSGNLCRCTGYHRIVDAVMEAAGR
jgi:carbon-monoxide dehydrogenase small subunit